MTERDPADVVGAPTFDDAFRARLDDLFVWRRDVRRFRTDPVAPALVDALIAAACLAPSVGFAQPWRFVLVEDAARRRAVAEDFERCNAQALAAYEGEAAARYAALKLAGLTEAPVHLAVFADEADVAGHGLGRRTMPETLHYSVVTAVSHLGLAARAHGVGVGWVSILDPDAVAGVLEVPPAWRLIAYLCLGYPETVSRTPELERAGWQSRRPVESVVLRR